MTADRKDQRRDKQVFLRQNGITSGITTQVPYLTKTGENIKMVGKKRLFLAAGTLASIGAVVALATGVTFGFFSATTAGQTNNFAAGTVAIGQSLTHTCAVTPMSPGDGDGTGFGGNVNNATEVACTMTVNYTGSVPAWLGLDVAIASTHTGGTTPAYGGVALENPTGAAGLYDSSANGLQVKIYDGTGTTYMTGTTLGGSATAGAGPSLNDLLVSKTAFTNPGSVTFTVDYYLPTSADNSYEGAASSITLTAHAVQANNNGSTSTCTAGTVCAGITTWA